ncbi:MAG TPA: PH domain-containing protein [bacterium]
MRNKVINFFKRAGLIKQAGDGRAKAQSHQDPLFKAMPSWWMVLFAYLLAFLFCYGLHQFFLWIPPYLKEVFKNLRGLPESWADIGLYWAERALKWIAVGSAIYHNLWQLGTRYKLTPHDLQMESWFPIRKLVAVPYGSVRRTGFQQSLVGLLLNYAHIEIDTGSPTGPLVFLNCPKPKLFLSILQPKVESVLQPGLVHHKRASDAS